MARLPGASILTAFIDFPDEAAIIGRILAGYSTLELDLLNCVEAVRNDFDTVFKVMFRTRGETQRIQTADALGRQYYTDHGLGTEFGMAIGSTRHCLKIRNEFAHCSWYDDQSGRLAYAKLEEIADDNDPVPNLGALTTFYVETALLNQQEEFAQYTDNLLAWLNYEVRVRVGQYTSHTLVKPKQMKQPLLHIP